MALWADPEYRKRQSQAHLGKMCGPEHPCWKGGRRITTDGYILIRMPEHPRADVNGYVRENRYIMEQYLGHLFPSSEHVHHRNGDKQDNRLENLELLLKRIHHRKHGAPPKFIRTADMRRHMSEAKRGKPSSLKGCKISLEHRQRVSVAIRKKWQDPEYRARVLIARKISV